MENPSRLQDNLLCLLAKTAELNQLRQNVEKKGTNKMDEWLQTVIDIEYVVDDINNEYGKVSKKYHLHPRVHQLNNKIIQCLKEVMTLIKVGKSIPSEALVQELGFDEPKCYSVVQLQSITSNFKFQVSIGDVSDVFRGVLPNGVQVAVKQLKVNNFVKDSFVNEVNILSTTSHRNLVKLYGFCMEHEMKAIIYGYLPNASLDEILFRERHSMIELDVLYTLAIQIAKALAYLHDGCSEQILHLDVKASNVLLDSKLCPRLMNFGLENLMNRDANHLRISSGNGSGDYVAPEIWSKISKVTSKADVYSFGILLFEIIGRRPNGEGIDWFPKTVWTKFEKNKLDDIIKDCGIEEKDRKKVTILSMVAFWCTQHTPQLRPTMSIVAAILEMEVFVNIPPNPFVPSDTTSRMQPDTNYSDLSSSNYSDVSYSTYSEGSSIREDDPQTLEHDEEQQLLQDVNSPEILLQDLSLEKQNRYSYNELQKISAEFREPIGSGAFGEVFKGHLSNGVEVAIKVLKKNDYLEKTFLAEMRTICNTFHENLVKLVGFCSEDKDRVLIYEYMPNGSLDMVLYNKPCRIEWSELYGIAVQVAKGLAYLHHGCKRQIIHHDIKAANVLLDSNDSPKLTDFGLASLKDMNATHLTMTKVKGTPGYGAPEVWSPFEQVTVKCDVYSFGMLLFEILGRANNNKTSKWFPGYVWHKFNQAKLKEVIVECGIEEKDRKKATVLSMVALWCAQFTPRARPSMSTVVAMLEKVIPVNRPPNPFLPTNSFSTMQPEQNYREDVQQNLQNSEEESS